MMGSVRGKMDEEVLACEPRATVSSTTSCVVLERLDSSAAASKTSHGVRDLGLVQCAMHDRVSPPV
jgi:hypothetical protein